MLLRLLSVVRWELKQTRLDVSLRALVPRMTIAVFASIRHHFRDILRQMLYVLAALALVDEGERRGRIGLLELDFREG